MRMYQNHNEEGYLCLIYFEIVLFNKGWDTEIAIEFYAVKEAL